MVSETRFMIIWSDQRDQAVAGRGRGSELRI